MFEVRIHGRGGQGAVTGAELLSVAAFHDGLHAQAFPSFGSERSGAPVVAFCRIDQREIRVHDPIAQPDAVIIQDPTLLHQVDVFGGLEHDGHILINSTRGFDELGLSELGERFRRERMLTVPATELARKHLGRPLPNLALVGGFAAITGVVSLESVATAIRGKYAGDVGERNIAAATEAFEYVRTEREERAAARERESEEAA